MGEIHRIAGREFNIGSPKQLAEILFNELKLPVIKRTKTGPSTDGSSHGACVSKHELPARIIEHRMLSKLKGTYLDALPQMVNPKPGRVHTSFSQVTAATGGCRPAIPTSRTSPFARRRPPHPPGLCSSEPGWKLVSADYSQIELRILAHYCEDPVLIEAFRRGDDIHRLVAAQVFEVPSNRSPPISGASPKPSISASSTADGLRPLRSPRHRERRRPEIHRWLFRKVCGVKSFIESTLDEALEKATRPPSSVAAAKSAASAPNAGATQSPRTHGRQRRHPGVRGRSHQRAMINVHSRLKRERHTRPPPAADPRRTALRMPGRSG